MNKTEPGMLRVDLRLRRKPTGFTPILGHIPCLSPGESAREEIAALNSPSSEPRTRGRNNPDKCAVVLS